MKKILFLMLSLGIVTACNNTPEQIGALRQKTLSEVHNNLSIDCGTLDRDYADYQQYKYYLEPLGVRYLRLQAGWAKTEKVKGVYDFTWLDTIIDDAVSRGLEPWLQLSYGNPIYPGGGTIYLNGGWPTSKEAVAAWLRWARANAERYKGKVHQWEIWNEPDNTVRQRGADPTGIVDLTIATARIIKEVDPDAKIAAFGLARPQFTEAIEAIISDLAKKLKANNEEHLIDWITYHGYQYIPEDSYFVSGDSLRNVLKRCNYDVTLWQGECGAPSMGNFGGALSDHDWTEQTQAKWDLRKVFNDHGNGIRTSFFAMADMNYSGNDAIKIKNLKGIVATRTKNNHVERPKMAYHAIRNFVSVFDNLDKVCDKSGVEIYAPIYNTFSKPIYYLFEDNETALQSLVVWMGGYSPIHCDWRHYAEISIKKFNCKEPVCVDLLNGVVYDLPCCKLGKNFKFKHVPYYDSPMLICDRSLVEVLPLK